MPLISRQLGVLVILGMGLLLAAWPAGIAALRGSGDVDTLESKLGNFGLAPAFVLEDASLATTPSAEPFSSESLRGKVWVLNFFFTHCPSICPKVVAEVSALQKQFSSRDTLRFVSVSIDPKNDNLQRIRRYAEKFSADTSRWKFLRGEQASIERLAQGLGISSEGAPEVHSVRLVVVDADFKIRGYYDALDPEQMRLIRSDLELLLGS